MNFFITKDKKWDVNKLGEFFIPDDNGVIQNIPLARGPRVINYSGFTMIVGFIR